MKLKIKLMQKKLTVDKLKDLEEQGETMYRLTLTLPIPLLIKIVELAEQDRRNLNNKIVVLLESILKP